MDQNQNKICLGADLDDGDTGVEFTVRRRGQVLPAFVVRFCGDVYGYINRCSHMQFKLNFVNDFFFDVEGEHLMCATHGALYDPRTGACLSGPCNGVGLMPLPIHELEGKVVLSDNDVYKLCSDEE